MKIWFLSKRHSTLTAMWSALLLTAQSRVQSDTELRL